MKKLSLIALAGMMMFAFAQCGGPFSTTKSFLNSAINNAKNAKDCDELEKVEAELNKDLEEFEKEFPDYKATEEEATELGALMAEYLVVAQQKETELCK